MARFFVYTSPARGHLFPVLGASLELRARGHEVHVRTLESEVEMVRSLGIDASRIDPEIEARELDDWRGRNPIEALELSMTTFGDRAAIELDDVRAAIAELKPDALLVDTNCWGAQAVAEASGLPWAVFQPYFTPLPARGIPPFGPGFRRSDSVPGRVRDAVIRRMIFAKMNRVAMPAVNSVREGLGLWPLGGMIDVLSRPPRVFYYTTEALEYPRREWPASFRMVGAATWGPASDAPEWLTTIDRPIALVTCSTERQNDRAILDAAVNGLPRRGLFVVATSAAYEPDHFRPEDTKHCRVEKFLPHEPVVARSTVVVCHGGMGITQRALSHGVPVVVIPFGRDQLEVARRVEHAGAGVRLMPNKLTPESLSAAVENAGHARDGARRIASAFAAAGGSSAVADGLEQLLAAESKATASSG